MPRGGKIPGVSGRRIPGNRGRIPGGRQLGGHLTNVPFLKEGSSTFREYHRQQVRDVRGQFAGGWGFAWQGLEGLNDNLLQFEAKTLNDVRVAAENLAEEMESYMKANAAWTDDTGNAREGLQAVVAWQDDKNFSIMLGHGAEIYYGIWLEVRWGGRFAIVLPTAQHFGPQLGARIKAVS